MNGNGAIRAFKSSPSGCMCVCARVFFVSPFFVIMFEYFFVVWHGRTRQIIYCLALGAIVFCFLRLSWLQTILSALITHTTTNPKHKKWILNLGPSIWWNENEFNSPQRFMKTDKNMPDIFGTTTPMAEHTHTYTHTHTHTKLIPKFSYTNLCRLWTYLHISRLNVSFRLGWKWKLAAAIKCGMNRRREALRSGDDRGPTVDRCSEFGKWVLFVCHLTIGSNLVAATNILLSES